MTEKIDIKALVQQLRTAADKATQGPWEIIFDEDFNPVNARITCDLRYQMVPIAEIEDAHPESGMDEAFQSEQAANANYIALANPENMEVILDALEAAKKRISKLEQQLIAPLPIGELIQRLEGQTGEPWADTWISIKPVEPKWISVADHLPEIGLDVQLYCSDTSKQMVGYRLTSDAFVYARYRDNSVITCEPTHWMELPAAPEVIDND